MDKEKIKNRLDEMYKELRTETDENKIKYLKYTIENYRKMFIKLTDK